VNSISKIQPAPNANLSTAIVERVRAGVAIDELRELYKFQREIEADANKAAFAADFAAMQAELPEIPERGSIDIGRGKPQRYALWEDVNARIKPVLAKHGFALDFGTAQEANVMIVTAYLTHHLGHTKQTTLRLPFDATGSKNAVQAIGSSVSYGKRYTAGALLNLTSRGEDDDGKSAAGNGNGHLTEAQIEELQSAIVDAGADIGRFCRVYGIAKVEELPARKLAEAKAKLASFKRQQEAR
jgi:ERF superfamily